MLYASLKVGRKYCKVLLPSDAAPHVAACCYCMLRFFTKFLTDSRWYCAHVFRQQFVVWKTRPDAFLLRKIKNLCGAPARTGTGSGSDL
jgi:hypothetical protein